MVSLLFSGILNTTYAGLQLYFWIMLAMFLMLAASNVLWYFFFDLPLKPLTKLFDAYIRNQSVAFIFDKNLHFVLKTEAEAKLVFDEPISAAKKAQKVWSYAPSGAIGKTQADLIFDDGRYTELESPNRREIDKAIVLWNETNPEDEIHTLIRFSELLHDGRIRCDIDKEIVVPWLRIRNAFTQKSVGSYAGYKRQLAKNMEKEDVSNYNNIGYMILAGGVIISLLMFVSKWLKLL